MALFHTDEPITDASVNCPECRAIDWVVRTPRLGGQAKIVCRACGHEHPAAYFPLEFHEDPDPEKTLERGRRHLERAAFPVYAPAGLSVEPTGWFSDDDDAVLSVTLACEEPWVAVTTERLPGAAEAPEALRDALMDGLSDEDPRDAGRSTAAWLLEVEEKDARLEAEVADLAIEPGLLRVEDRDVPARILRTGRAWAAYARLEDVVVIASSAEVPMDQVTLVRHR